MRCTHRVTGGACLIDGALKCSVLCADRGSNSRVGLLRGRLQRSEQVSGRVRGT